MLSLSPCSMGIVRPDPDYNPAGRDEKQVEASAALLPAEGKGIKTAEDGRFVLNYSRHWKVGCLPKTQTPRRFRHRRRDRPV